MADADRTALAAVFADAVRRAIGMAPGHPFVALHEPEFRGHEWDYVKECLDTGWVSTAGKFVDEFERQLAAYTGAAHAVAVVNGTAALHLALLMAGVESGDEVLVPTLSFVATANAVAYCQAVPHFVEADPATLGMDPVRLDAWLEEVAERGMRGCINRRSGRRIAAVVPMHTFGHPVDLGGLLAVAERWGLPMVEDAAESLGSRYKGRHCGTFGRLAAVSFNGNKIMTTGGGGAILTNDPVLAARTKHLSSTAKKPHPWLFEHDAVGFNYRLPNINAALGCAQLEQVPAFVERKRALAERYRRELAGVEGVRFVSEPEGARSNYWLNVALVPEETRDDVLRATNGANLMTRPAWTLLHTLPMYRSCPRMDDLGVAESLERRLINLPSSSRFGD